MKNDLKSLLILFTSTFKLSAFTFGGGYVIVPLMKRQFADKLRWIDENEMLDIIAIGQSSPGALAVNVSVILGYRMAGFVGSLVTVLGTILPPLILLSIISIVYDAFIGSEIIRNILRGMQAGVSAVILDVIITMGGAIIKKRYIGSIVLMFSAFVAVAIFHINVVYVLLVCALVGLFSVVRTRGKGNKA